MTTFMDQHTARKAAKERFGDAAYSWFQDTNTFVVHKDLLLAQVKENIPENTAKPGTGPAYTP